MEPFPSIGKKIFEFGKWKFEIIKTSSALYKSQQKHKMCPLQPCHSILTSLKQLYGILT